MSYEQYLNSRRWKQRKIDYYSKYNKVCKVCCSSKYIQLHHRTYERIGHELDNDLFSLCARCHFKVHELEKSGYSLIKATEKIIEWANKPQKPKLYKPKKTPFKACTGIFDLDPQNRFNSTDTFFSSEGKIISSRR